MMFKEIIKAVTQALGSFVDEAPVVELTGWGFYYPGYSTTRGRVMTSDGKPIGVFRVMENVFEGALPYRTPVVFLTVRTPEGVRKVKFEVPYAPLPPEGFRSLRRALEKEEVEV